MYQKINKKPITKRMCQGCGTKVATGFKAMKPLCNDCYETYEFKDNPKKLEKHRKRKERFFKKW